MTSPFSALDLSGSGLTAQRLRMGLIAANLANASSATTPGATPYQAEFPVFATEANGQVAVVAIAHDPTPGPLRYEPGNPLANAQGEVRLSNVNPIQQLTDLVEATRSYQANATALMDTKTVDLAAINILG